MQPPSREPFFLFHRHAELGVDVVDTSLDVRVNRTIRLISGSKVGELLGAIRQRNVERSRLDGAYDISERIDEIGLCQTSDHCGWIIFDDRQVHICRHVLSAVEYGYVYRLNFVQGPVDHVGPSLPKANRPEFYDGHGPIESGDGYAHVVSMSGQVGCAPIDQDGSGRRRFGDMRERTIESLGHLVQLKAVESVAKTDGVHRDRLAPRWICVDQTVELVHISTEWLGAVQPIGKNQNRLVSSPGDDVTCEKLTESHLDSRPYLRPTT